MPLSCLVRLLILHLVAAVVLVAQDPPSPWQVDGLTLVCDEFSSSGALTQSVPAENIDGTGWATGNATTQPRREAGLLVAGGTDSAGSIVVPPLSALGEVTVYATVRLRGTTSGILVGWTDDVRHPRAGGAGPLVRISGDRRLTLLQDATTSLREVVLPESAVVDGTVTLAMVYRLWEKTVSVSVHGQEQVRATLGSVPASPRRYLTVAYDTAPANTVPALDALRVEYVPLARPMPMVSNRTITVTDTTLTGITNAIRAANQISGPGNIVTVSIPRGNYTFNTPTGFTGGQLFLALGLRYIIIDWNGSNITIADPDRGLFSLSHGNHVIVRNIASIDYPTANLPFTQGTVRAMKTSALTFDVEIDAGFPLPNNAFFTRAGTDLEQNWGQVIDPNRPGAQAPNTGLHYHVRAPTLVAGRTFRYTLNTSLGATRFGDGFKVGSRFAHCPRQGNEIFRIFDANDIRLENVTGYACGNFWSMASVGATFSYHNVRILVKPGRLMSSNGDGVTGERHASVPRGNRGWIEHCIFEGMADDACNQMQADGLFVSDTIFRNTRRFGVWINGTPNVIIKDCVFDHVGRLPISGSKDPHKPVAYPFASQNVLIVRNAIRSAWDDGIQLSDTFRDDFGDGTDMSPSWNSYWRIVRNTVDTRIRIRNARWVRCVGNGDGAGNPAEVVIDGRNCSQVTSVGATWPRPQVTGLTPEQGPTSGGTKVLLTGTGLCDTAVTVDGLRVYPDSTLPRTDLRLYLTMPAHAAGRVQVGAATFLAGSSTAPNGYTYGTLPTIAAVTPSSGLPAGGTTITITGTNLTGTTAVTLGGVAATGVTVVSATSVQCVTPAHAEGTVAVVMTTAAGSVTQENGFTYALPIPVIPPPTVANLSPVSGSTSGGTTITITGTNLTGTTAVTLGGVAATGVTVVSATSVQCVTPAHAVGTVAVVVTTASESVTQADAFTYVLPIQAPAFTTSPTSVTATVGGVATFTAGVTGQPAPTLQWQRQGVAIPGATGATYTTPALTAGDQGAEYRCIATNSAGTAMSLPASVTIREADAPGVIVSSDPSGGGCGLGSGLGVLALLALGVVVRSAAPTSRRHAAQPVRQTSFVSLMP
jgi:hypothetical protein